ncbi:hypothetical protein FCIRC_881 [Fusarium circinatum]|uniref:Fungal N-terminal domain-containing protein n=1 Tax=Fusarium circinatum TaxID=48490 RepID=A0A8H5UIS9_FUSCI|nr:hypothetical protein FCIRC_881 [Fusarium circinatum]
MAEAFGIAGSAFGTVSLGLQLFKEISQYLDDIDGREEDLKEARNYATNIQLSLNALDVAISNAPTGDAATKNAIDSCKASCISAVNNLLAVVKELKGPTITLPNSNVTRAKELCAKLKYPFKKQNIQKLEEILSRTNSALQTVLQVFQLNMGHTTTSALNNMHQAVVNLNATWERNTTALDEIYKTSQLHDEKLTTIQQDVRELLILTRDSDDSKLLLKSMAQQVSDLTSRTCVAVNLLQNPVSHAFIPNIETTSYQGGGSLTFNAFCSCHTQRVWYSQRYWGPLLLEAEVRSRDHHAPECPMSKLPASTRRTKRVLSLLIPTGQLLWGRASKVSLSFTTGAGILGLGQKLTWVATVDEDSSPVFRMVRTISSYEHLQRKDTHTLLASCFRRLVWCYANYHASVTDVNEDGDTVLEWLLRNYGVFGWRNALKGDNMAELCQMLAIIVKPTACRHKATASPIQAVVASSGWLYDCTRPVEVATAILSHYNQSVGHCHPYSHLLSWRQSDYDRRRAHTLFQSLPQVAENLEFGPLACAVINQDLNRVRQLLQKSPSHITEINYCGQLPIHLAIETQNVAIIKIILHYAEPKVLNARDNEGRYPIDYAIRMGKHAEEAQAVCCACKVLELLLHSDTGLFPASLHEGLNPPYMCTEAQKMLIKGLAERRERLKQISYQSLSPVERQGLGVNQARILDQIAVRVQSQLEARGCSIPMSLKVYEEKGKLADAQKSIYSYICSVKVAEYAHQLGFYYSDNEFWDFVSSFPRRIRIRSSLGDYYTGTVITCTYLCWMIDRGSNISETVPDTKSQNLETGLTTAHYFMASLGLSSEADRKWGMDYPLPLSAFKIVFSDTILDNCRCWCSQSGRSPLTMLLAGICLYETDIVSALKHDWFDRVIQSTEFTLAGLFSTHNERIKEYQWVFDAILRRYTSFVLDLCHFCGVFILDPTDAWLEVKGSEIQEEDSFLFELFESLLEEFRDYPLRNVMRLEDFFGWMRMVWAPRMREVEQYLDNQRLTDEQRRDAESIGVVWETGPQPRGESSKRCDVGEPDLWDAMDELDQIATDPERPTKENLQTHT